MDTDTFNPPDHATATTPPRALPEEAPPAAKEVSANPVECPPALYEEPSPAVVLTLRALSIAAAYGCWLALRWLLTHKLQDGSKPLWVALVGLIGLFWLLLGTAAPNRWVVKVWEGIGRFLLYALIA